MGNNYKSDVLKEDILNEFRTFMDDLLSICESEIERQFLLFFIKYIFKDIYSLTPFSPTGFMDKDSFDEWCITSIKRIWEEVDRSKLSQEEINEYLDKGYNFHELSLVKTIGIEFKDEHFFDNCFTIYKIIPQFKVDLKRSLRLDFALFAFHHGDDGNVTESKIAIECDGFEYHSTKDQLTNDNQKNRILQFDNWKIYRMSGSEIFTTNNIQTIINDMRRFTK